MKVRCFALLALCLSLATASMTQAATIMLDASKDASIFQNNVNNSSGAGNGLIVGTNAQSSARRAAIAFDVASALPAGAIIQDVKLHLTLGAVARERQRANNAKQRTFIANSFKLGRGVSKAPRQ